MSDKDKAEWTPAPMSPEERKRAEERARLLYAAWQKGGVPEMSKLRAELDKEDAKTFPKAARLGLDD